ncbi:hypothetical protein ACU6U9_16230 [Pseudomonas sp. HK3]|jgi:hypothetical protein
MKILAMTLKIIAVVSTIIALMAFGSDLLPVEITFGGHESAGGEHQFYKIVLTEGVDSTQIGICFLLAGFSLFVVSALIRKYLVK